MPNNRERPVAILPMPCPFNILIQGDKKVPAPPKRDISTQIQKKTGLE
jgi:hypothetical protein